AGNRTNQVRAPEPGKAAFSGGDALMPGDELIRQSGVDAMSRHDGDNLRLVITDKDSLRCGPVEQVAGAADHVGALNARKPTLEVRLGVEAVEDGPFATLLLGRHDLGAEEAGERADGSVHPLLPFTEGVVAARADP